MRALLCSVTGGIFLIAAWIDLMWNTLGTHGGGPISARMNALLWRGALASHRRWPHHRALSFVGSLMLIAQLVLWTLLFWCGAFLIYSADVGSVISARTMQPANAIERLYFVAYTISTMGNGDFQPNGSFWRIVTSLTTLGGLATLTLAITFLLNVLPAVVQTRQLGVYLANLGRTPYDVVNNAWDGETFDGLTQHLIILTPMILLYTEQHLAYPVLHYYHAERRRPSATLGLAVLHEVCLILGSGVSPEVRMSPMVLKPLKHAMDGLKNVISREFIDPEEHAPEPPSLEPLRETGIPTVDDEAFARSAAEAAEVRRFFAGLVADDGWKWSRIYDARD